MMAGIAQTESYAGFVSGVVALVQPLMPGDADSKMRFSGCYGEWGWPCSDSATLRGRRALFLELLATEAEDITGIDRRLYKTELGPASLMPLLSHSAYARNIRRWEKGVLPRKTKARADFALVAACWLLAWGDAEGAPFERASLVRRTLDSSCAGQDTFAGDRMALVETLWAASSRAYRASLDSRKGDQS